MIVKSEDLPQMKLDSHESLAENMHIRRDDVFSLRFCAGFFFPVRAYGKRLFRLCHTPATERSIP